MRTMYIPVLQRAGDHPSNYYFLARVQSGDPMRLAQVLAGVVREADPGFRIRMLDSYSTLVDRTTATERIMATLGGFFGLLALVVACLRILGVMAFQVSRRINEIGLRMALGATRSGIVALVLREVAVMLGVGSMIGGAAALTLTSLAAE